MCIYTHVHVLYTVHVQCTYILYYVAQFPVILLTSMAEMWWMPSGEMLFDARLSTNSPSCCSATPALIYRTPWSYIHTTHTHIQYTAHPDPIYTPHTHTYSIPHTLVLYTHHTHTHTVYRTPWSYTHSTHTHIQYTAHPGPIHTAHTHTYSIPHTLVLYTHHTHTDTYTFNHEPHIAIHTLLPVPSTCTYTVHVHVYMYTQLYV